MGIASTRLSFLRSGIVKVLFNDGYPYLRWEKTYEKPAITTPSGTVTQVTTIEALDTALTNDENIELMNDLDFNDDASYSTPANKSTYTTGNGWTTRDYSGTFYGKGFAIKNIFMNNVPNNAGFISIFTGNWYDTNFEDVSITGTGARTSIFATPNALDIINCTLSGSISGGRYSGFCGIQTAATNLRLHHLVNYATITSSNIESGGIIGRISNGEVEYCFNYGEITGGSTIGGICGFLQDNAVEFYRCGNYGNIHTTTTSNAWTSGIVGRFATSGGIKECLNKGIITSEGLRNGGLTGQTSGGTIDISDSYNFGKVETMGRYKGGIVGWLQVSGTSTVNKVFSIGDVLTPTGGVATDTGALNGSAPNNTVTDSFWDEEKTGLTTSAGGGVGKTTAEMKDQNTYTNWNFDNIWGID